MVVKVQERVYSIRKTKPSKKYDLGQMEKAKACERRLKELLQATEEKQSLIALRELLVKMRGEEKDVKAVAELLQDPRIKLIEKLLPAGYLPGFEKPVFGPTGKILDKLKELGLEQVGILGQLIHAYLAVSIERLSESDAKNLLKALEETISKVKDVNGITHDFVVGLDNRASMYNLSKEDSALFRNLLMFALNKDSQKFKQAAVILLGSYLMPVEVIRGFVSDATLRQWIQRQRSDVLKAEYSLSENEHRAMRELIPTPLKLAKPTTRKSLVEYISGKPQELKITEAVRKDKAIVPWLELELESWKAKHPRQTPMQEEIQYMKDMAGLYKTIASLKGLRIRTRPETSAPFKERLKKERSLFGKLRIIFVEYRKEIVQGATIFLLSSIIPFSIGIACLFGLAMPLWLYWASMVFVGIYTIGAAGIIYKLYSTKDWRQVTYPARVNSVLEDLVKRAEEEDRNGRPYLKDALRKLKGITFERMHLVRGLSEVDLENSVIPLDPRICISKKPPRKYYRLMNAAMFSLLNMEEFRWPIIPILMLIAANNLLNWVDLLMHEIYKSSFITEGKLIEAYSQPLIIKEIQNAVLNRDKTLREEAVRNLNIEEYSKECLKAAGLFLDTIEDVIVHADEDREALSENLHDYGIEDFPAIFIEGAVAKGIARMPDKLNLVVVYRYDRKNFKGYLYVKQYVDKIARYVEEETSIDIDFKLIDAHSFNRAMDPSFQKAYMPLYLGGKLPLRGGIYYDILPLKGEKRIRKIFIREEMLRLVYGSPWIPKLLKNRIRERLEQRKKPLTPLLDTQLERASYKWYKFYLSSRDIEELPIREYFKKVYLVFSSFLRIDEEDRKDLKKEIGFIPKRSEFMTVSNLAGKLDRMIKRSKRNMASFSILPGKMLHCSVSTFEEQAKHKYAPINRMGEWTHLRCIMVEKADSPEGF
ncbi:MAG: hypothetical protein KJ706_04570, partial [Candidatus Omnitrophica bacterium]|nr:hypothetical protein [Candidatus Omnitrophota bacterium]